MRPDMLLQVGQLCELKEITVFRLDYCSFSNPPLLPVPGIFFTRSPPYFFRPLRWLGANVRCRALPSGQPFFMSSIWGEESEKMRRGSKTCSLFFFRPVALLIWPNRCHKKWQLAGEKKKKTAAPRATAGGWKGERAISPRYRSHNLPSPFQHLTGLPLPSFASFDGNGRAP